MNETSVIQVEVYADDADEGDMAHDVLFRIATKYERCFGDLPEVGE